MARRRPSLHRVRAVVLTGSVVVQLPALIWLTSTLSARAPALVPLPWLIATTLTVPYLALSSRSPFSDEPKPAWLRYLALWPFFAWWASCGIYCVLGALAYGGARLAGADPTAPLAAALAVSTLGGLWSVRRSPRIVELDVIVRGLPAAFDGFRVGQISDVHCSSYTPKSRVVSWVAALNAERPDLIAVTGDLVSSGDRYTDDVASALGGLKAPDGVFACMGNHDYFCNAEKLVAGLRRGGVDVLRNAGVHLERDGATLYVAGIEDSWTGRHDMSRTLADRREGEATLLLAHDPNHFPAAAKAKVEVTLSGHTHGGQMALPLFGGRYNLARLMTRFTHGLFADGGSQLYVSRGVGTTGPPVRLFAPAELTVLTLRAAQ